MSMSCVKFFAPPEWDADVPIESGHENLAKKAKLRKSKKWLTENGDNVILPNENKTEPKIHEPETKKRKKTKDDQNSLEPNDFNGDKPPKKKKKITEDKSHSDNTVDNNSNKQSVDEKILKKQKKKKVGDSSGKTDAIATVQPKKEKLKKKKKKSNDENLFGKTKIGLSLKEVSESIKKNKKIQSLSDTPKENEVPQSKTPNAINSISKNARRKLKLKTNAVQPISNLESKKNQNQPIVVSKKTEQNRKRRRKKNTKLAESSENVINAASSEEKKRSEKQFKKVAALESKSKIIAAKMKIIDSHSKKNESRSDKGIKPEAENSTDKKYKVNKLDDKSKNISKNGKVKKTPLFKAHLMKLNSVLTEQIKKLESDNDSSDTLKISNNNLKSVEITKKSDKNAPKSLRERMLERIKGARFRYLNEQMYIKESKDAKLLFNEDPSAFEAYHNGYRQQVSKWPLNPLDVIINDISQLPKEYVIADLGCGDGRLGKSVPQKVHSFDLVSLDPSVQACDMSHTPLLTAHCNIVVFCLSLMGTNLVDYIVEANRILKIGGTLKIAEVESRFDNVETFLKDVQKFGFSLIKSDLNQNLFYFMDFKKENEIKKKNKLPTLTLNPCLYKKR